MRLLFDWDVLLDVGLDRAPWVERSGAVLALAQSGAVEGFVAWHSLSNIDYFTRTKDAPDARTFISALLGFLEVAPVGHADMQFALKLDMPDLEDAMQAAAAVACGADRIVTRNTKDFKNSVIPAVTPSELLREIPKRSSR